jgi:hypothetical protein
MSAWSQLIQDVQNEIENGVFSFREIAARYSITYDDVNAIASEMMEMAEQGE